MKETVELVLMARVSTTAQADVFHGSIDQQINRMKRWVENKSKTTGKNFVIFETIIEKGQSGKRENFYKRKAIKRIFALIRSGKKFSILLEKLDRFSRYNLGILQFLELAGDNGIPVYTIDEGLIDMRDRRARLMTTINGALAEDYTLESSEKKSKKNREAFFNNGKDSSTHLILGLDRHPEESCMYVINKIERTQVSDIYNKFLVLQSYKELIEYCKRRGYKTKVIAVKETIKGGKRVPGHTRGGEDFDKRSIKRLLTNQKLRGEKRFEDTWNQFPNHQDKDGFVTKEYAHGRVVPKELTDKVDEVIKSFKKRKPRQNKDGSLPLLKGSLKSEDGRAYNNTKGGNYRYYIDSQKKGSRIRQDKLDKLVVERVKSYLSESETLKNVLKGFLKHKNLGVPAAIEKVQEATTKVRELEASHSGFAKRLSELMLEGGDEWKDVVKELVKQKRMLGDDLEEWKRRLEAAKKEKEWLVKEVSEKGLKELYGMFMKKFDQSDSVEKKAIIQAIVPEVIVKSDSTLEMRISPDPRGRTSTLSAFGRHGGGKKFVERDKWRE